MWRTTLRGIAARRSRFAMTAVAIVLAALFTTGSLVLATSVYQHYTRSATDGLGGMDVVVHARTKPLAADTVARLRALPQVGAVAGDVVGDVRIVKGTDPAAGSRPAVDSNGNRTEYGVSPVLHVWNADASLTPYRMVTGAAPRASTDLVVDRAMARETGLAVGDSVVVNQPFTEDGRGTVFRIAGLVTVGGRDGPPFGQVALTTADAARRLLGVSGWTGVYASAARGTSTTELVSAVSAALKTDGARPTTELFTFDYALGGLLDGAEQAGVMPAEAAPAGDGNAAEGNPAEEDAAADANQPVDDSTAALVLTGDQARAAVRDDVTSDARTLVSLVAFFSMVAVLVGMFVIANTFSVLVAQRTRELALLRALGAGRRQISRSVRAESLLLGVVLSVVGATGGVLAVHLVALTARTAGRPLPLSAGVIVPWWSLAVGGGVTALATVLAARGAARRASRVAPIEALTEAAQGDAPLSRTRWVLTALLTGVIALMATSEEWMVLAALLLAAPAVLLGPALAPRIITLIGGPLRRSAGAVGGMAVGNARRNPRRAAATANALLVGVSLITFVATMASTLRAAVPDGQGDRQAETVFTIVYVLLAMAVCIAVVGVANTVGLNVLERTRELGLLRAIGATRTQVRRLVTLEAVVLALMGTVLGEGLGVASSWLYIRGTDPQADLDVVLPTGPLATLLAGGVLVGLLAAALPARRAANLDPLTAVATA